MTRIAQAQTSPEASTGFDWPEPVVIDALVDLHHDLAETSDRLALARLQAEAWRELVAGRAHRAASLRLELAAEICRRGGNPERIGRGDLAVFAELTRLAAARFRTSPRLRSDACANLDAALRQIEGAAPRRGPALVDTPA